MERNGKVEVVVVVVGVLYVVESEKVVVDNVVYKVVLVYLVGQITTARPLLNSLGCKSLFKQVAKGEITKN